MRNDKESYIPKFTNISSWDKDMHSSTGGTRSKKIYTDGANQQYFFKGSKKLLDGSFKYPTEFWSEIAASKIGQMRGFNVLDYNIAYDAKDEQQIGCLSESMIDHSENKLSEGVDYLRGFKSSYNPKTDEGHYTLAFILEALQYFRLTESRAKILEMIIFDACIGNSDRHQENWWFITYYKEAMESYDEEIRKANGWLIRGIFKMFRWATQHSSESYDIHKKSLRSSSVFAPTTFAPIYDSGCSLGRENPQERIAKMMENELMMSAYVDNKSKSEIRWKVGKKPTHFELLFYVKSCYPNDFMRIEQMLRANYSLENMKVLIQSLDEQLPSELSHFKLAHYRKDFMIKVVALRIEKILQL